MSAIHYRQFDVSKEDEDLEILQKLIAEDLSEPYSIYVYRYFLQQSPDLCFLAYSNDIPVGVIVCSLRPHRDCRMRGYIAMLVVKHEYRGKGIAKQLVTKAVNILKEKGADEITLETEVTNVAAMTLYENLGFLRTKRLHRYYLNSNDAFRLILPLTQASTVMSHFMGII